MVALFYLTMNDATIVDYSIPVANFERRVVRTISRNAMAQRQFSLWLVGGLSSVAVEERNPTKQLRYIPHCFAAVEVRSLGLPIYTAAYNRHLVTEYVKTPVCILLFHRPSFIVVSIARPFCRTGYQLN